MQRTTYPDDAGLVGVLTSFDVAPDALLGHGGESWVYALPGGRVLRVFHAGTTASFVEDQRALLDELSRTPASFQLPQIVSLGERSGRLFVIERRLPGSPGLRLLDELEGAERRALIEAHLEAAAQIGDLHLAPRSYFGELLGSQPIRGPSWREYLALRAEDGLARSGGRVPMIDVDRLVADLDDVREPRFVHLDAFLDNMLFTGTAVSALLDFGVTSAVGDRRFDVVSAVVYLSAPAHTPNSTDRDASIAHAWLRDLGLADLYDPVRRWLAAFWAFDENAAVTEWSRSILLR